MVITMHWTDWLLTVVGGAVMLLTLVAAAFLVEWLTGMLMAIMER
jgi:hypothetical protein